MFKTATLPMMCWLYHLLALMNMCHAHKLNWCDITYINLVFSGRPAKRMLFIWQICDSNYSFLRYVSLLNIDVKWNIHKLQQDRLSDVSVHYVSLLIINNLSQFIHSHVYYYGSPSQCLAVCWQPVRLKSAVKSHDWSVSGALFILNLASFAVIISINKS